MLPLNGPTDADGWTSEARLLQLYAIIENPAALFAADNLFARFDVHRCRVVTFMWQPVQTSCSMATIAASPLLVEQTIEAIEQILVDLYWPARSRSFFSSCNRPRAFSIYRRDRPVAVRSIP